MPEQKGEKLEGRRKLKQTANTPVSGPSLEVDKVLAGTGLFTGGGGTECTRNNNSTGVCRVGRNTRLKPN